MEISCESAEFTIFKEYYITENYPQRGFTVFYTSPHYFICIFYDLVQIIVSRTVAVLESENTLGRNIILPLLSGI